MPLLASFRQMVAPFLGPVSRGLSPIGTVRRKLHYFHHGMEGIARELRDSPNQHVRILREFGASVGDDVSIHGPIYIVNGQGSFRNLTIGNRCHLGTGVMIDLADRVTIKDEATLAMQVSIVTHINVGPGPLKERRPRKQGPVVIERGAYLGIGATVLHGVTIGEQATIGAHALIDKDVPAHATMAAPRARLVSSASEGEGDER